MKKFVSSVLFFYLILGMAFAVPMFISAEVVIKGDKDPVTWNRWTSWCPDGTHQETHCSLPGREACSPTYCPTSTPTQNTPTSTHGTTN